MSLQALRRWIARHPIAWVLGLALTLGGAQLAATAHEFSHVASAASERANPHVDAHADDAHGCPICLLAAALGGAAPAPIAIVQVASQAPLPAVPQAERSFTARVTLAYASRAPPSGSVLSA